MVDAGEMEALCETRPGRFHALISTNVNPIIINSSGIVLPTSYALFTQSTREFVHLCCKYSYVDLCCSGAILLQFVMIFVRTCLLSFLVKLWALA